MDLEVAILALGFLFLAVVLFSVALAGWTGTLPRNRWAGIRNAALRASDAAWVAGHRAAAPGLAVAGIPPLAVGFTMLLDGPDEVADWLLVYIVAGLITGGLIALSVRRAERAATEA